MRLEIPNQIRLFDLKSDDESVRKILSDLKYDAQIGFWLNDIVD